MSRLYSSQASLAAPALCLLLASSFAPSPVRAEAPAEPAQEDPTGLDPQWSMERFAWTGELPEGARIRLVNEFGDIRTRDSAGARVDVSAVIQQREDVAAEFDVHVRESDEELLVEVRFPAATIDPGLLRPGMRPDRRVDLVVFVPPGAELEARTVRGLLEAKGLSAHAELSSERGDIVISTSASASANTRHGAIRALFKEPGWTAPVRLETLTGDVSVELPPALNADAHVSTRAHITSDYSIEIVREGLLKTGRAVIGAGGQDLRIVTNKGGVQLLASIR